MASWPGAMMALASSMVMQLRLDLVESSAPAVALWELVDVEQRQRAVALLAALIARAVGGEAVDDELVSLLGAGAVGGRDE